MAALRPVAVLALLAVVGGCGLRPTAGARPRACTGGMVETRLFFGLSMPDGRRVSTADWATFLADVVTPRFPDGLTVLDAHGQYRFPDTGEIRREPTRVLLVVHPDDAASDGALDAIVADYRRRFAQRSVLRVDTAARVRD